MNTVTHDVSFSFDQPEHALNALQRLLQHRLSQFSASTTKTSKEMIVRQTLTVLVIDSYQERAQYVASHLHTMGYHPVLVNDALDAFTLFLQGTLIPFAVVLGQEDTTKHFFLLRLLQRMTQKFRWNTPVIRLLPQSGSLWQQTGARLSVNTAPLQGQGYQEDRTSMLDPSTDPGRLGQPADSGTWTPMINTAPLAGQRDSDPLAPAAEIPSGQTPVPQMPFPDPVLPGAPAFAAHKQTEKSEMPSREKVSLVKQNLGRYHIGNLIGSSTYSDVYQMYDRLREQECALKAVQTDFVPFDVFVPTLDEVTIFQQEAELLEKLQHPHILPVLNCGKSYVSGSPFIYKTMPYCAERSIAHWIERHGGGGSFAPQEVVSVVLQLADALQFAHDRQVIYQNFKLSNILIINQAKKMSKLQVAWTDFALQDGSFVACGSDAFLFMSPERWEGRVVPASDQYGLAAIVYDLLTGRPPFQGSAERVLKQLHTTMQVAAPSTFNAKIPASVDDVLLRALAKKPDDRFSSMWQFAQALQRCFA